MAPTSLALLLALAQTPTHHATVEVRIVVVDVTVLDGDGDFVSGLEADDFVIYEDDRPREVESLREVRHQLEWARSQAAAQSAAAAVAPPPPPARQFIFFLDASSVTRKKIGRYREATAAAADWAARRLRPEDRVTILRFDGRAELIAEDVPYGPEIPELLRSVSLDAEGRWGRAELAKASAADGDRIELYDVGELSLAEVDVESGEQGSQEEGFGEQESLQRRAIRDLLDFERRYRTDRFADTLEWLADRIQQRRGRKAIVLLSEGHEMSRTLADRLRDEILPRLRSADASLYAISTFGAVTPFDRPPAAGGSPLSVDISSWEAASPEFNDQLSGIDRLSAEAGGADLLTFSALQTGGRVLRETDAFDVGLEQLSRDLARYYSLSFTPVERPAGTYHSLRIEVRGRPELAVRHRPGYVMPEPVDVLRELGVEDEEELAAPELVAEPMLVPLPTDGDNALVGVLARVPPAIVGGDAGVDLEISIEVRDLLGQVIGGLVDEVVVDAGTVTAAAVLRDGLEYVADVEVPPMAGEISLRIRDRVGGALHASTHPFDVSLRAVAVYLLDLDATPVRVRGNVDGVGPERRLVLGDRVLHPRAGGRAAAGETVFVVLDVDATEAADDDRLDFSLVAAGGAEEELGDVRWSLEGGEAHGQVLASLAVPAEAGRWELRVTGRLGGSSLIARTSIVVESGP